MAVAITTAALSGNVLAVTATFTDEDSVGVTPTSLTYTIKDEWGNTIVAAATPGTIASVTTIALSGTALSLATDADYKQYRQIIWDGLYNSSTLGNDLPIHEHGWFVVDL